MSRTTHARVLRIAAPIMLSNVTTPLLGVVDMAVLGRLPDPVYVGAVALGAMVFSAVFWAFGFLRMGTTGLTAQARGAGDADEVRATLGRGLLLAAAIGVALILLQAPIAWAAAWAIEAPAQVEALTTSYVRIRIWAGPATLANYALLGWFIGTQRADLALALQLLLNLSNIALDAWFVLGLGLDVQGVAGGTVIAEYLAATVGLVVAAQMLVREGGQWDRARLLSPATLARTLAVHRDIAIRSLALIAVFAWFTAKGAEQGEVLLAANAVLMQLVSVSAFFLDGIAYAAETLVGEAVGAGERSEVIQASRRTTVWAVGTASLLSIVYAIMGPTLIDGLTVDVGTRQAARTFLPWAAWAPLAGVWAFQLDGVFIGATATVAMRNAMLASLVIFAVAWWGLLPWGNHGLWAALWVHYAARTATLLLAIPALLRRVGR